VHQNFPVVRWWRLRLVELVAGPAVGVIAAAFPSAFLIAPDSWFHIIRLESTC